jgi:hypothetical protein
MPVVNDDMSTQGNNETSLRPTLGIDARDAMSRAMVCFIYFYFLYETANDEFTDKLNSQR